VAIVWGALFAAGAMATHSMMIRNGNPVVVPIGGSPRVAMSIFAAMGTARRGLRAVAST
jgi:hypothetical protein